MRHIQIILFLICLGAFASSTLAGDYVGSVLYPINPPPGYSSQMILSSDDGQVVGYTSLSFNNESDPDHALLWTTPNGAVNIIDPAGFTAAVATFTNGINQVGYGDGPATQGTHALYWYDSAAAAIDLNPSQLFPVSMQGGSGQSFATGMAGDQVAGYGGYQRGLIGNYYHALVWNGPTSASAIDLNPTDLPNLTGSQALQTDGQQQVGQAFYIVNKQIEVHAMVWAGSAATAVDLNPTNLGFFYSQALSVSNNQQVGYGESTQFHALLWTGSADSVIDLNPASFPDLFASYARSTNGSEQVGYGSSLAGNQALLWFGTAASAMRLQPLLPTDGVWNNSNAQSIDANGDIFGYAHGTYDNITGFFAVEWTPVPEPKTFLASVMASAVMLRRRKR